MNPTPKTSPAGRQSAAAKRQASWEYSEEFVAESEHSLAARRAAAELGVGAVSQGGAALLTLLTRTIGAKSAVEIGTGTGVSGLAILSGLTSDGILTSIDSETEHQQRARAILGGAGVAARRARLIAGPALVVLPKLSDGAYDLVFVDGDPLEIRRVRRAGRPPAAQRRRFSSSITPSPTAP